MGFFWEEGRDPSFNKISNYDRQQRGLLREDINQARQLQQGGYGDAMSLLQQYLNPESDVYKNFEQPYLQQFNQQTIPQLAERFAGANAMGGGLMTSGFGQALGAAGANLQTQLAQMKEQYRRQSINDLINQYNTITGRGLNARPFENIYDPGTQGQLGFGGKIIDTGLQAAAAYFGGPAGGAAYRTASNAAQSAISSNGQSGGGYQGRFGELPNFGGY